MKERYEAIQTMIEDKKLQISKLEYELNLIKIDCLREFKNQNNSINCWLNSNTVLSNLVSYDFKPIKKKIKSPKNNIEIILKMCQENFELDNVEFNKKPMMCLGPNFNVLEIYFYYMDYQFQLDIPFAQEINSYDCLDKGFYRLLVKNKNNQNIWEEIESFYDFDETAKCLKKALDEYTKEHKGGKKDE